MRSLSDGLIPPETRGIPVHSLSQHSPLALTHLKRHTASKSLEKSLGTEAGKALLAGDTPSIFKLLIGVIDTALPLRYCFG